MLNQEVICVNDILNDLQAKYGHATDMDSFKNAVEVLQGHFVSKEDEAY